MAKIGQWVKCGWCGRKFRPKHHLTKYCGENCYLEKNRSDKRKSYKPKHRIGDIIKCIVCKRRFTATGPTSKYCSDACSYEITLIKNRKARGGKKGNRIGDFAKCATCKKSFAVTHTTSKYCSKRCYQDAQNAQKRRRKNSKFAIGDIIDCVICDSPFTATHPSSKYCSPECYGQAHGNIKDRGKTKPWRKAVLEKDDYTCQDCNAIGVKLIAHHHLDWIDYPESRFNVLNGITLCVPCHHKRHGWKPPKKRTAKDKAQALEDYMAPKGIAGAAIKLAKGVWKQLKLW